MPLSLANRGQRDSLVRLLKDVQSRVTPYTDELSEVRERLEDIVLRLNDTNPSVLVKVCGAGRCGKSEFINALLGDTLLETANADTPEAAATTQFEVQVVPGISKTVLLREGMRTLAVEAPAVRDWIAAENRRRRAAAPAAEPAAPALRHLPREDNRILLELTPPFLSGNLSEIEVHLADTTRDAHAAHPSTGAACGGDAFVVMLDYQKLKTAEEPTLLSFISNSVSAHDCSAERFVFIVSNADALFLKELSIINVHITDGREEAVKFRTTEEVIHYVTELIRTKTPLGRVRRQQVAVVFSRLALLSRVVSTNAALVPLETLYDYCELGYGSAYMQRIDQIPVDELRNTACLHAEQQIADSGLASVEQTLSTLAYNSGLVFLLSAAVETCVLFAGYSKALEGAQPALQAQEAVTSVELRQLKGELASLEVQLSSVRYVTSLMRSELDELLSSTVQSFWAERLDDLTEMLSPGASVHAFKSRRQIAAGDIIKAAGSLHDFVAGRYLRDRRLLESKKSWRKRNSQDRAAERARMQYRRQYGENEDNADHAPEDAALAAEEQDSPISTGCTWEFLKDNRDAFLRAVEQDLANKVLDIGQAFAHYVKDELLLLLPVIAELCERRKGELLVMLSEAAGEMFAATAEYTLKTLDVGDLARDWQAISLVEPDLIRVNNFIRELAYEAGEAFEATLPQLDITTLPDDVCVSRMREAVAASWRGVAAAKTASDIVSYDAAAVAGCLETLLRAINAYVSEYDTALRRGVALQEEDLDKIQAHRAEISGQLGALQPIRGELDHLVGVLKDAINWDFEDALAFAQEEAIDRCNADV
ncbi:hypothetical protein DIPPA_29344 [Diplonema papillatum]|nr:hypothetical protein DIPPA_29344 [Diplonema papillatum]